jgi:CoA:oxalate CoA-transferase
MLDGQIAILESAVMRYAATGQTPAAMGNRHPSICPFEPYETLDRPLVVAAGNNTLFEKLCRTIQRPELVTDPRFQTNSDRNRHAEDLKREVEATLRQAPATHWQAQLEAAGVPSALVNTVADAVECEQVQSRHMIVEAGGLKMAGNPIKLSAFADTPTRRPAPALNADGDHIRCEFDAE